MHNLYRVMNKNWNTVVIAAPTENAAKYYAKTIGHIRKASNASVTKVSAVEFADKYTTRPLLALLRKEITGCILRTFNGEGKFCWLLYHRQEKHYSPWCDV